MTVVNKSATFVGTAKHTISGRDLMIWIGANSNTGETIIWYLVPGDKVHKLTGGNLTRFATELSEDFDIGNARWTEGPNNAALDQIAALVTS